MDRIYQEVSEELNIKKTTAKNVYKHLFLSVANVMKKGEYQNILLSGFGKFIVKPTRKRMLDEKYRKNGIQNNNVNKEIS